MPPHEKSRGRKAPTPPEERMMYDRFENIDLVPDEERMEEALKGKVKYVPPQEERMIDIDNPKPYTEAEDASDATQPQAAAALQATPTPSPEKPGIQAFIRPVRRAALQAEAQRQQQQNDRLRILTEAYDRWKRK